jgi:hypothetical protein
MVAQGEDNADTVMEIVLVGGLAERIAKSGQQVIDLGWPERYGFVDWNVHPAAEIHREGFGCGCLRERAASGDWLAKSLKRV